MADNYLEKRYEDVFSRRDTQKASKGHSFSRPALHLDTLLLKNRSYRAYDNSRKVSEADLMEIVSVNTRIPSARNAQILRFRLIHQQDEADFICKHIRLGAALSSLQLPQPGSEPPAFIIICSTVPEDRWVDIDLGISAQSMLLRAVEMDYRGICIGAFDRDTIKTTLDLCYTPLLILAIGKGTETIQLLKIRDGEDQRYYRKEGIHYVPKIALNDLIL